MFNRQIFKPLGVLIASCLAFAGIASAGTLTQLQLTPAFHPLAEVNINVNFPTAGDAYLAANNGGAGTLPAGGQTGFMWAAGDFVESSVFVLPTTAVNDLTAGWQFQDFIGGGNTETWFVYVNGVAVAQATLPDDNFVGDILSVSGTVNFGDIAPVAGGYQVELVLQNSLALGDGSIAWLDGGITGLSYDDANSTPEPGSLLLLGSGLMFGGLVLRRKRRA